MCTEESGAMTRTEQISERKKVLYAVAILVAAAITIYTALMLAYDSIDIDLTAWQLGCSLLLGGLGYLGIWIEETRAARRIHRSKYIIG